MTLEETLRIEGGRVLATLIRWTGDIQLAEDALQDALLEAVRSGSDPDNPAAWLTRVARNKALDRLRREAKRGEKEQAAMRLLDDAPPPPDGRDDRLRLIFTCCHPALDPEARVALALRTVCGLTTDEIARVFLVKSPTMGQRISRAKKKISQAQIPYRVPAGHELSDRLPAVLATVNAVYTVGHHTPGDRVDLAREGIRLARVLVELMPDEPECLGLLALFLATEARRPGRGSADAPILLADQDRTLWDTGLVDEAVALLDRVKRMDRPGPFQVQAVIAATHSTAGSFAETDWSRIVAMYDQLDQMQPSVVVKVNRAVAIAEAHGPEAALESLEPIDDPWHFLWAARAEFNRRRGDVPAAREALQRALEAPMPDADRTLLLTRLQRLD